MFGLRIYYFLVMALLFLLTPLVGFLAEDFGDFFELFDEDIGVLGFGVPGFGVPGFETLLGVVFLLEPLTGLTIFFFSGVFGFGLSTALTSNFYSVIYADILPFRQRMVSQLFGIFMGGIYGIIISNKPNLIRFDELGPDYLLGRIARDEIMQWGSENAILQSQQERSRG